MFGCCFLTEFVGGSCVGPFLPGVVAPVIEIGHATKELAGMAVGGLEGFASEFGHFDGHVEVGLAHGCSVHIINNQPCRVERLYNSFSLNSLMYAIA